MAAFEIIALDPVTPQLRAPGSADTYLAPRAFDIQPGTLTTAIPVLDMGVTWNNAGVTFTGLNMFFTNSASSGASRAIRLGSSTGGNNCFSVSVDGSMFCTGGASNGTFSVAGNLDINAGTSLTWNGGDLVLRRDAAGILAQRDGTNPQTFRIYRSFTNDSNRGYTALTQDATTGFIIDSVNLGSVLAPTNLLDVRGNGATAFRVLSVGAILATTSFLGWQGRSSIASGSDGRIELTNSGGTSFNSLVFGNALSIFPALKRSGATIHVRLGDDSAFADIEARSAIQNPVSSLTLSTNGQFGVEMTSNSAGNLVYRGSDGTTRRAALTFI